MDYLENIIQTLKPILKDYGMKKKNYNWYYENDSIIKIFNIQKSAYGKQVYLNIGIKIKSIDENHSSTIGGSHIYSRLDDIVDKDILDFENNISNTVRCKGFSDLLKSDPYNFFTLAGSDDELKIFIQDSNSIIFKIAKEYLKI